MAMVLTGLFESPMVETTFLRHPTRLTPAKVKALPQKRGCVMALRRLDQAGLRKRRHINFVLAMVVLLALVSVGPTVAQAEGEGDSKAPAARKTLPNRWFYVNEWLKDDASVARVRELVDIAAAHGLNGMVFACGMDAIAVWPEGRIAKLKQVDAYCRKKGIDLIPLFLSAGYGHGVSKQDPNLVAGLPINDVLFEVKDGVAQVVPDRPITVEDGGFENAVNHKAKGFSMQDSPGSSTVIDTRVAKEGKASLRFNLSKRERLAIRLDKQRKHYVLRFWIRGTGPKKLRLDVCVYDGNKQRKVIPIPLVDGADWKKIEISICTLGMNTTVFLGSWGQDSGRVWIDGVEMFEPGLLNVLRRSGTPVTVKNKETGELYVEGKDFEPIADPNLDPAGRVHPAAPVKIIPAGRIEDGEKLLVSYYTPVMLRKLQPILCLSEPKVYEIWRKAIRKVNDAIGPKKWFLDMDEIRGGGTCHTCWSRKKPNGLPVSPGEMLGECVTRQVSMIREVCPKAEIAIWGDMFDPNHNAKSFYYTAPGGFSGSFQHVPKDLIMVPWNLKIAEKSLKHFSSRGFRTLGGAYYDKSNLDGCKAWLRLLDKTPSAIGIMYTTWYRNYKLLGAFGDLVRGSQAQSDGR